MPEASKVSVDEIVIVIDAVRSVTVNPTPDGETVVLMVEDPHSVAGIEMTQSELGEVINALSKFRREEET
jgi:hypothetical protein